MAEPLTLTALLIAAAAGWESEPQYQLTSVRWSQAVGLLTRHGLLPQAVTTSAGQVRD